MCVCTVCVKVIRRQETVMMKLVTVEMLMSHLAYVSPCVHINAEKLLSSPAAKKKKKKAILIINI